MENRLEKHFIIVGADTLVHGYANTKREYSSTIIRIYVFLDIDGTGPLKSTLSLSKGCVALIREVGSFDLKNCGFNSQQMRQLDVTLRISSIEYGRFLLRMK